MTQVKNYDIRVLRTNILYYFTVFILGFLFTKVKVNRKKLFGIILQFLFMLTNDKNLKKEI